MEHLENKTVIEVKLTDITCDICSKSCRDKMDMNYEMMRINASWGYCSHKDGTTWECDICEDCADMVKQFIESIGGKIIESSYI